MTSPGELTSRIGRVQQLLAAADRSALVASPGADLRYLCGHDVHLSERITALVIPAEGDPVLITPELEQTGARSSAVGALGLEIIGWSETDDPYALITQRLGGKRVLVSDRMWAQHIFGLQSADSLALSSGADLMAELRMRKSGDEVAALRFAAGAIDAVHADMQQWLRVGRTEADVAADIARAIVEAGHSSVDFVIVGSGPNGASPHHDASDRVIERGDMVVIDIGGTTPQGYCSDSTRTYIVGGSPTDEMLAMYEVLQHAQSAATSAVRPDVAAEDVDAAAREVISEAGYAEHFIHRTGHGIGLESHEPPYIVEGNRLPLAAGMAFSVEPGIYLPGRFGARIEDIVVVTESGVDVLNQTPRELRVLGG